MRTDFSFIHNEWFALVKRNEKIVNVVYALNYIPGLILIFFIRSFYSDLAERPLRFLIENLPLSLVILSIFFIKTWVLESALLVISALSKDTQEELSLKKKVEYIMERFTSLVIVVGAYTLLVMVGLLFFIVPGLIFMAKYSQAFNFVLISGDTPREAFKKSALMTQGTIGGIIKLILIFTLLPGRGGFFGVPLVNYVLWKMHNLGSLYEAQVIPPLPPAFRMTPWKKIVVYSIIALLIGIILLTFYQISQLPK